MITRMTLTLLLCVALHSAPARASAVECEGRFVNPSPTSAGSACFRSPIGSIAVSAGSQPDTSNLDAYPDLPDGDFYRVGLAIGYWSQWRSPM